MENLQNQNASSISIIPTLTTAGASTNNKGKQLQVLTSRKRNVDDRKKSQIWNHFTKLNGDPKTPKAECNYCENDYACHTTLNETSNI
jgi:hypothetical protein